MWDIIYILLQNKYIRLLLAQLRLSLCVTNYGKIRQDTFVVHHLLRLLKVGIKLLKLQTLYFLVLLPIDQGLKVSHAGAEEEVWIMEVGEGSFDK